jgi:hypothetical protein
MKARCLGLGSSGTSAIAAAAVVLSACAAPVGQTKWVKAGADDTTVAREIDDCRARAAEVQATQYGINADRSATLGRNWALSYTTGLQDQTMRQQAAAAADQAFNSCMRAKGFAPRG